MLAQKFRQKAKLQKPKYNNSEILAQYIRQKLSSKTEGQNHRQQSKFVNFGKTTNKQYNGKKLCY